jgi:hypothetical protein
VFLLVSLPLAVAPFVSFTWSISPIYAVQEAFRMFRSGPSGDVIFLGLLAAIFFLGIPIVLWQLRLLIWPRTTMPERVLAYALGALAGLMSCVFVGRWLIEAIRYWPSAYDWLTVLSSPFVLIAGGVLLWFARRSHPPASTMPTICLHAPYLANAVLCLLGFWDRRDPGWWLTAFGSSGLLAELFFIFIRALQSSRAAGPHR